MPEIRVQDGQGRINVFPDGSTPEMIAKAMGVKPPDQSAPAKLPERSLLDRTANDPNNIPLDSYAHATESGLADVGQGIAQDIQGVGRAIAHPIDTVKGMFSGAKALPSQAATLAKDPPDLADFGHVAGQTAGQLFPGIVAPEATEALSSGVSLAPKLVPSVKTLTAPVRMAARSAEGLGSIPGVGSTLKTLRNAAYANTPVEDIPKFKMPLQNFGLSKNAGAPLPEAPTPAQALQSRIATERGMSSEQLARPKRSEGLPEVEAHQPIATKHLELAVQPREPAPPLAVNTSPARMQGLLEQGTGAKKLQPNVPLRQQMSNVTPARGESSVIKSHSYDPAVSELTVTLKDGRTYVHGDVSPEQAATLEKADSKGRAWSEVKRNSTYVGKVINGKRVYAQPPVDLRKMTPQSQPPVAGEDLTPILKESLKRTKKK